MTKREKYHQHGQEEDRDSPSVQRTDDMLMLKFARLLDIVGKQDIYDFLFGDHVLSAAIMRLAALEIADSARAEKIKTAQISARLELAELVATYFKSDDSKKAYDLARRDFAARRKLMEQVFPLRCVDKVVSIQAYGQSVADCRKIGMSQEDAENFVYDYYIEQRKCCVRMKKPVPISSESELEVATEEEPHNKAPDIPVGRKRIYGIDLGTTNSAIAFVDDAGKAEIVKNMEGDRVTPSVVLIEESDTPGKPNFVVGKVAKESGRYYSPENVIAFVKQEMGTCWEREILGVKWRPETVSACVLKKLKEDAKFSDLDVKDVVIACPAYFDDAQRKATEVAGEIAGLNVVGIVDEPMAAALHYGLDKLEGDRTAIVYDLGGATFDVTVVRITKDREPWGEHVVDGDMEVFRDGWQDVVRGEIVCSDGNHRLGGKNWDDRIVQLLASKFAVAAGVSEEDLLDDADTLPSLQTSAEILKTTLTSRLAAKQKVTYGGVSERVEITREEFNEATKDLLGETVALTNKMFELAKEKGVEKINDFLLVGGSTRMPQVQDMVKAHFAHCVDIIHGPYEVDEAVAKGAALFANIRNFRNEIGDGPYRLTGDVVMPGKIALPREGDESHREFADIELT